MAVVGVENGRGHRRSFDHRVEQGLLAGQGTAVSQGCVYQERDALHCDRQHDQNQLQGTKWSAIHGERQLLEWAEPHRGQGDGDEIQDEQEQRHGQQAKPNAI